MSCLGESWLLVRALGSHAADRRGQGRVVPVVTSGSPTPPYHAEIWRDPGIWERVKVAEPKLLQLCELR